jgi:hypothetical protein
MYLSTRLNDEFSARSRQEGTSYFRLGRVRIEEGSKVEVEARVQGSRTYSVGLDWDERRVLSVWCDCPSFDTEGRCAHLWATILAADADRHLTTAAAAPVLILDGGDLAYNDSGDDDDDNPFPSRVIAPAPTPRSRKDAWKKQIAGIATVSSLIARATTTWPAKREIIYIVDVLGPAVADDLSFRLGTRDRKADGSWNRVNALTIKTRDIPKLPVPEDREIIARVAGSTLNYSYGSGYNPPSSSYTLSPLLARSIMRLAGSTGRCFLRKPTAVDDLIPITWDDGGEWQFGLKIHRRTKAGWAVSGVFRRGEERIDLVTPELITLGGLIFSGNKVAPLRDDAAFEWIGQLRHGGEIDVPKDAG